MRLQGAHALGATGTACATTATASRCRAVGIAVSSLALFLSTPAHAADPAVGTCAAGQRSTSESKSADKTAKGRGPSVSSGNWKVPLPRVAGSAPGEPTGGCIADPNDPNDPDVTGATGSPATGPSAPGGTGNGGHGRRRAPLHAPDYAYSPYPYAEPGGSPRTWRLDATAEGAYAFNDTARTNAGLRMFSGALELSASANLFLAPYGTGATVFGTTVETAWLGDVGASLASPTADGVHFHYGGGVLYWNNGGQAATGGYGSYGIDFFPTSPVIISTVAKVGGLGGEWYFDLRGTAGVSLGQIEAYVGYSHLRVGGVSLGGPLMGIRMWL